MDRFAGWFVDTFGPVLLGVFGILSALWLLSTAARSNDPEINVGMAGVCLLIGALGMLRAVNGPSLSKKELRRLKRDHARIHELDALPAVEKGSGVVNLSGDPEMKSRFENLLARDEHEGSEGKESVRS